VPQCAVAFEQVSEGAGVPVGVYTNLFLNNDQAGALIDDPRVKAIALTGSERAGVALASRAGKNLKKSTMELGGSDAFIVLDDATSTTPLLWPFSVDSVTTDKPALAQSGSSSRIDTRQISAALHRAAKELKLGILSMKV